MGPEFDRTLEIVLLDKEWKRQVQRYIELGFHKELGLSEEKYRASLPKIEPQPKEYEERFDIPLLVETRIPWKKQYALAGVVDDTQPLEITNIQRSPRRPYTGWFQDGTKTLGKSLAEVRVSYLKDEAGGNILEGLALFIMKPEVLNNHYILMPGTKAYIIGTIIPSVDGVSLFRSEEGKITLAGTPEYATGQWDGSLSRGKKTHSPNSFWNLLEFI